MMPVSRYRRIYLLAGALVLLANTSARRQVAPERVHAVRARFYGATAMVTGTVVRSRDGSELGRSVSTDVFEKSDDRWRAVSAEETMVSEHDRKGK
jgi:hypothetical protein